MSRWLCPLARCAPRRDRAVPPGQCARVPRLVPAAPSVRRLPAALRAAAPALRALRTARCPRPRRAAATACARPPPFDARRRAAPTTRFPWDRLIAGFKFHRPRRTRGRAVRPAACAPCARRRRDALPALLLPVPLSRERLRRARLQPGLGARAPAGAPAATCRRDADVLQRADRHAAPDRPDARRAPSTTCATRSGRAARGAARCRARASRWSTT